MSTSRARANDHHTIAQKRRLAKAEAENRQLRATIGHLTARIAELEGEVAASLPIRRAEFDDALLCLAIVRDTWMVYGADVVTLLRQRKVIEERPHWSRSATEELKRLGLGQRELVTMKRTDLRQLFNVTSKTAGAALGLPPTAQTLSFVTPLGVDTLEHYLPGLRKWFDRETAAK
ncbi:MAG TPA: hypothetical protein VED01_28605 [Burkholderiales bacterium]|nr:hypothetical protein [Burkholderiales bacterium]